jgi:hypothetical protein
METKGNSLPFLDVLVKNKSGGLLGHTHRFLPTCPFSPLSITEYAILSTLI